MKNKKTVSANQSQILKVEASAGSGKTRALSGKFIEIILNSTLNKDEIPLNSLIAITFTNKAAVEMKSRILETLKSIAFNIDYNGSLIDFKKNSNFKKDIICKSAEHIIDNIVREYDFFKVQTIHSFIREMLKGSIFKIGRSAGFRVAENFSEYLTYSFDELIDQSETNPELMILFENFIQHYIYIKENPPWIPKNDILDHIEVLYGVHNIYGYNLLGSDIRDEDIWKIKGEISAILKKIDKLLPEGTDQRFQRTLKMIIEKKRFTSKDFKKTFLRQNFPVKKNYNTPHEVEKLWRRLQKTITEFCESESVSLYNPYISIFNNVYKLLDERSRKDDLIFLEELNKHIHLLIADGHINVPEICCRVAPNIKHYLIDEFQDTSILDWNNLSQLIEDALARGGSLFYVGDKKQAIYRFRGGEPRLFDAVPKFLQPYKTEEANLGINYRSEKEIVMFNNRIFSPENLRRTIEEIISKEKEEFSLSEDNIAEILHIFHGSIQNVPTEKENGYVYIENIDGEDSEDCNDKIFNKIIDCIHDIKNRGFSYGDVAILTRSNKEVETLTALLLSNNINVVSDKTLSVKENRYINEIIAFLQFLDSPIDNRAFASFILGDIFLKATELSREEIEKFIFSLRGDASGKRRQYFYTAFRAQFGDIWEKFIEKEFFKKAGIFPLYEFVRQIYETFQVFEHFPMQYAFFMRFIELIKEEEIEHRSVSAFLEFINSINPEDRRLYVDASETHNAVKILTYHKAKGLEFPVVIIPFLSLQIKLNKYMPHVSNEKNDTVTIKYIIKSYVLWSKLLEQQYKDEYVRAFIDELNILYVAMTRAKYELFGFIPERLSGIKHNRIKYLVSNECIESGIKQKFSVYSKKPSENVDQIFQLEPTPYRSWIGLLTNEFIEVKELIRRKNIKKGKMLHCILSYIGNCKDEDIELIIKNALGWARTEYDIIEEAGIVEKNIRTLITHKAIKDFFFVDNGTVYTEKELVDIFGNAKRVDRLIVKEDSVLVIDFKSAREQEDYREKVLEYMEIIKDIYKDKIVGGYLIYIESRRVEEVSF